MEKIYRAGMVPYVMQDGEPLFCLQLVSDPLRGGPDPQISKGKIEEGEDEAYAAIREAQEELGLKEENMMLETLTCLGVRLGRTTFFHVQVLDKENFGPFCNETRAVEWLSLEEFETRGRELHRDIIREMYKDIIEFNCY